MWYQLQVEKFIQVPIRSRVQRDGPIRSLKTKLPQPIPRKSLSLSLSSLSAFIEGDVWSPVKNPVAYHHILR
jgi:hypothetical protein